MFESFLTGQPNPRQEQRREEDMLNKQLTAGQTNALVESATDPNSDMTFLEQQRQKEDLTKWQQDLDPELQLFQHDLRNEYFDENKGWAKKQGMFKGKFQDLPPLCNEYCIQKLTADIRPMMSKNLMMSSWQEERILRFLLTNINAITIDLGLYRREYGIQFNHTTAITNMIKNITTPTFFRALANGERKFLSTINRRIETHSENQNVDQPKKGWMNFGK